MQNGSLRSGGSHSKDQGAKVCKYRFPPVVRGWLDLGGAHAAALLSCLVWGHCGWQPPEPSAKRPVLAAGSESGRHKMLRTGHPWHLLPCAPPQACRTPSRHHSISQDVHRDPLPCTKSSFSLVRPLTIFCSIMLQPSYGLMLTCSLLQSEATSTLFFVLFFKDVFIYLKLRVAERRRERELLSSFYSSTGLYWQVWATLRPGTLCCLSTGWQEPRTWPSCALFPSFLTL